MCIRDVPGPEDHPADSSFSSSPAPVTALARSVITHSPRRLAVAGPAHLVARDAGPAGRHGTLFAARLLRNTFLLQHVSAELRRRLQSPLQTLTLFALENLRRSRSQNTHAARRFRSPGGRWGPQRRVSFAWTRQSRCPSAELTSYSVGRAKGRGAVFEPIVDVDYRVACSLRNPVQHTDGLQQTKHVRRSASCSVLPPGLPRPLPCFCKRRAMRQSMFQSASVFNQDILS